MYWLKHVREVDPRLSAERFAHERMVAAVHDQHWVNRVPGWRSPELVAADPLRCRLWFQRIEGRVMDWRDLTLIVDALLGAAPAFAAGRGTYVDDAASLARTLPEPARGRAQSWLSCSGRSSLVINGDLHPQNILAEEYGLAVVDWELGRFGHLAEEVSGLLLHALRAAGRGAVCPSAADYIVARTAHLAAPPTMWSLTALAATRLAALERSVGDTNRSDERVMLAMLANDRVRTP